MIWEYKYVNLRWTIGESIDVFVDALNTEGKEGWEVVTIDNRNCYFKRLVKE